MRQVQSNKSGASPLGLLRLIRTITHKHDDKTRGTMVRVEHDHFLYMCFQKPHVPNVDYYKTFKSIKTVIDMHWGRAGFHKEMFNEIRT